jgi:hypothetical protein
MYLRQLSALLSLFSLVAPLVAGFGLTASGNALTVDTSGGLVFTGMSDLFAPSLHDIRAFNFILVQANSGDITSMKFNSVEVSVWTISSFLLFSYSLIDPRL